MVITYTLSISEEKRLNNGEDAFFCQTITPNDGMIACMDGCGGSGSVRYPIFNNWSGARIASRLIGQALSDWFVEKIWGLKNTISIPIDTLSDEIHSTIESRLQSVKELLPEDNGFVISRLSRVLPSTLAAVMVSVADKNLCRICSFWAGDSRTYFFPVAGLQQTSRDNIRGNDDPFDCLMRDDILNNVICADKNFRIHAVENWTEEPCMVIVATDGCFSYFPSPMYFEWAVLESLIHADTPLEWEEMLKKIIGSVAGDDYTLQIAVVGFSNFQALKTAYEPRYIEFQNCYAVPLKQILEQGDQEAHYRLWLQYKQNYMMEN